MIQLEKLEFGEQDLDDELGRCNAAELDSLDFGVIGFDLDGLVCRYNAHEARCAGLTPSRVIGLDLFSSVAPCMNNYLVAQRFEDALASGDRLDLTLAYVLTLRMKPVKVRLRLLARAGGGVRYVLIDRRL